MKNGINRQMTELKNKAQQKQQEHKDRLSKLLKENIKRRKLASGKQKEK